MTLSQQLLFLRSNRGVNGSGEVNRRKLTWCYRVQPTPLAREYTVRISLEEGATPDVFVDNPLLVEPTIVRSHMCISNPLRLYLYLPGTGEWYGSKRIDQTIISWNYL